MLLPVPDHEGDMPENQEQKPVGENGVQNIGPRVNHELAQLVALLLKVLAGT